MFDFFCTARDLFCSSGNSTRVTVSYTCIDIDGQYDTLKLNMINKTKETVRLNIN